MPNFLSWFPDMLQNPRKWQFNYSFHSFLHKKNPVQLFGRGSYFVLPAQVLCPGRLETRDQDRELHLMHLWHHLCPNPMCFMFRVISSPCFITPSESHPTVLWGINVASLLKFQVAGAGFEPTASRL